MSYVRRANDSYFKPFHNKNILAWILSPIQDLREIHSFLFFSFDLLVNCHYHFFFPFFQSAFKSFTTAFWIKLTYHFKFNEEGYELVSTVPNSA